MGHQVALGLELHAPACLFFGLACRDDLLRALANDRAAGVVWGGFNLISRECFRVGGSQVGGGSGEWARGIVIDRGRQPGRCRIATPGPARTWIDAPIARVRIREYVTMGRDGCQPERGRCGLDLAGATVLSMSAEVLG